MRRPGRSLTIWGRRCRTCPQWPGWGNLLLVVFFGGLWGVEYVLLIVKCELQPSRKQETISNLGSSEFLLDAGECSSLFSDVHGEIRKDAHLMSAEHQQSFLPRELEDPLFNLKVVDFNNHRVGRGSWFGLGS